MAAGYVYFLVADAAGLVKVGRTADPEGRLKTYASWSPVSLRLAATLPGGSHLERRFHAAFKVNHSHHEWFFLTAEIAGVIDRIAAGGFDIDTLPPPASLAKISDGWSAQKRTGIALKAKASQATYEANVAFSAETRWAYDSISGLTGEAWERAAQVLRNHAREPLVFGVKQPAQDAA